jgi:hypothetical protein
MALLDRQFQLPDNNSSASISAAATSAAPEVEGSDAFVLLDNLRCSGLKKSTWCAVRRTKIIWFLED